MKKFLSLVLALVMTMSLVTISAGAKDFTDDEAITYDEAVAVISAVKVVDGYTDGSFKPTATLTRGAAAKIICNLILGPTTAAELPASVAPFSDVPANSTFAGYIAYCAKEGIVGGYADGTFKPGASLTGYAFMKMLLGALGYDAEIEGYNDPKTWSISVAKQALGIGLNAGLLEDFNGVKAVTREEAALYAFNTLKATMVDYDTKTSVNVGDATVTIAGSTAKPVAWNNMNVQTGINNDGNIDKDGFVQFAEQYFTKLKGALTLDVFGRPARAWEYKSEDLGTYVAWDLQVGEDYTEKVTGKDLYDLLGKSVIDDYDIFVFVDGVEDKAVLGDAYFDAADMNKNNKDKVGETGDGVLTQVFVNADGKEVFISIINTYLAIADSDYSSKKEEASFSVYALGKKTVGNGFEYVKTLTKNTEDVVKNVKASLDDFAIVEDVKKDDAYLVQVAEGEIQTIEKAEVVADTEISAFKLGSNVTAGGEKYGYAATAEYDVEVLDQYTDTKINLKDVTYNIYLDAYGNLIGVDLVEVPNNYVFITGVDSSYSYLTTKNVDAAAIFIDGTMETIKVNASKSTGFEAAVTGAKSPAVVNTWFTYTKSSDGVYTLKVVGADPTDASKIAQNATGTYATVIDKKHIALPGATLGDGTFANVYGNDSTVYLTASVKEIKINAGGQSAIIIDDVDSVTTGVKNANIQPWNANVGGSAVHAELSKVNKGVKTTGDTDTAASQTNAFHPTAAGFSSGVYALYKNNGYMIAAVVVGEDSAASKNLVYTHTSKVEMEAYDKATDKWTWTRKVISEGEEIEIKEVGDALTYLDTMNQYGWYQVKYNANGEVIGIDAATSAMTPVSVKNGAADAGKYASESVDVPVSVQTYDTVLYHEGVLNNKPAMKGSTLYAKTTDASGFFVAEDAKIVLIQTVKNKQETTYEVGADALEDVIDALNENYKGAKYNYTISAIIEKGAATVVVVKDDSNSYVKPEITKETTVTLGATTTIKYYGTDNKPTEAEAVAMIEAQLAAEGYTVVSKDYGKTTAGTYTWEVTDARGFTVPNVTFVYSTGVVQLYKVTLKISDALKAAAPGLTASADVSYVAAGGTVTVTIKNPTAIGSAKNVSAKDATGTAVGSNVTSGTGSTTVTATWTMPSGSGAKDVILTVDV